MKTILIPIDFTDGSMMTVKYAIHLAGNDQTQLHLFHIYPDQLMIPDSSFPTGIDSDPFLNTELIIDLRKQAEQNMLDFTKSVESLVENGKYANMEVSHLVTGGDPEWEINEIVRTLNPDLIVMGTRGEGRKAFLEGSMAEKIMIRAEVPVLAVPETVKQIRLRNIMYPTNFSESDYQSIKSLIGIFDHFDSRFHIVHFELKKKLAEDRLMMDALQHSLQNEYPEKKLSFHLMDSGNKADALKRFTNEKGIDLIAFIAHKTNIFQNLFSSEIHKKDFFKLELPMMAMHEG